MHSTIREPRLAHCAIAALLVGATACGSSSLDDGSVHCKTKLAYETGPKPGYTSPSVGALLLEGTFYTGESVLLYYRDDAGGAHNTTATVTGGPALSYSGLPSGTRTYAVYVTCAATDDEFHPWVDFTIK